MSRDVESFLAEVKIHLHLEPGVERRVISELSGHFQDKVTDLRTQGLPETEAVREAVASFGPARDVARLMYEACSRGSWTEALISLQPHILVASLFAAHLWRHPLLLTVTFAIIAGMAILGWRAGTPNWTYAWAGYAFFPPLAIAYVCRHVPSSALASLASGATLLAVAAKLVGVAILYGATFWMLAAAVIRVSRRDWIFVSLMLLPMCVLGLWAYSVEKSGQSLLGTTNVPWDRAMAWLCTGLGLTSAAFVRMRPRLLKAVAVVTIGIVAGALVVLRLHDSIRFGGLLAVCIGLFALFMSPLVIRMLLDRNSGGSQDTQEVHAS